MAVPVIEGYTDLVEVGRGGFGVVYRATQPAFERTVAIKVITAAYNDEATLARFERECRAAGALSGHPNIVRVYGAGRTDDGMPFMVMDYLSGGSVAEKAPFTVHDTIALGVAVAGALETAHRSGIIHRDLKPENILYSGFGSPQLVDFGIARMRSAYETKSGSISATLTYAAPEVISGAPATPFSDIYSLASVLHFMLTGNPPFWVPDEESLAPLLVRIATAPPPPLPGVPPALAELIASGLAKEASQRPASAGAFGEALQAIGRALGEDPPTLPIPLAVVAAASSVVDEAPSFVLDRQVPTGHAEGTPPALDPVDPAPSRRKPVLAAAAVVVLIGAATGIALNVGGSSQKATLSGRSSTPTASPTSSTAVTATTPPPVRVKTATPTATPTAAPATEKSPTVAPVVPGTTKTTPAVVSTTVAPVITKPKITKPGAVPAFAVAAVASVSQEVQGVSLSWKAPSSTGGESPSYKITCQVIVGGGVYTGANQGGCAKGTTVFAAAAGATSKSVTLHAAQLPASSYLRWRIVAHNSAGDSAVTPATTHAPDLVGKDSYVAFALARVAEFNAGGGQEGCTAYEDIVCRQSPASGTYGGGTAMTLWFASTPTPRPT